MDKAQISEILEEIAVLLELKGENPFKALAYTKAARALDNYDGDLARLVAENRLAEIGLGDALREKVSTLVITGRLEYHEALRASVPEGLLTLLDIPALGPKKIRALHEKLAITNVVELENACREQRVRALAGFGARTEEKILEGIARSRANSELFRYAEAWAQAEEIRDALRDHEDVIQVAIAGSMRRGKEIIKDLDFVASSARPAEVMDYFISLPGVKQVTNHGPTKSSILLENGIVADLRVVSDREYPYALHHFTGSKEHNVAMRQRAIAQGKKLSEWGLFEIPPAKKGDAKKKAPAKEEGQLVPCRTEDELFAALGLQYIPPELREDLGEIEAAEKREIPRLLDWTQLRGAFHCHTNWSDGRNTLAEMAGEARELGLDYLGIADHSKSSIQANGLNEIRLAEQIDLIAQFNKSVRDFHVFAGSEVDILKDGRLDFSDDILARLDYVVASVHSLMNQSEDDMTARVIRAMENEHVTMVGHATGRLLLHRDPSRINLEKIIDAAARTGTWIELNCSTHRMDMDWRWWRRARDKGVKCVINPDAHRISQFAMLRHGVTMARKGWLRRADVINTLSLDDVRAALAR